MIKAQLSGVGGMTGQHDVFNRPLGHLVVTSAPGQVDGLPGYTGPRNEAELGYTLAPRRSPFGARSVPAATGPGEVDGRVFENFKVWRSLRFMMRADALMIKPGETETIYFTTHLGQDDGAAGVWTEIGFCACIGQPVRFFTYDPQQNPTFRFHGEAKLGRWYEMAIQLDERGNGPYNYETLLDGTRVRTGTLPGIQNQVDVSHETFYGTSGKPTPGDHVMAAQGWLKSTNDMRWFAADIILTTYVTTLAKTVRLVQPSGETAYRFDSFT